MKSGKTKSLHEGMTDRSAASVDASMKCGKGSVDSGATRSGTAPTPKTLGPRDA